MSSAVELYHNVHQQLIDSCKQHDQMAQREVYRLYYKAMYNTALRVLNDSHLAEDIMQEAFLKAFSKIHTYNNTSSFGAWLKRIVINESINEIRKQKPEYSNDDFSFREQDSYSGVVDEDVDWTKVELKRVKTAMGQLSDRYRTVLNLILLEGYDHREVAQIMDVSYNNTRVLYTRAKQKLQSLIKNG